MSIYKLIGGIILNLAIFGAALFLPAVTLNWGRAWLFLGIIFIGATASTLVLYRSNRDLLEERFKPLLQKGQPLADKIILITLVITFIGVVAFIPLDVFRLHLLPKPGMPVALLGLALFIAGWWVMTLALQENAFAIPVVKSQKARQQMLIETGLYSVVRHPMYACIVPLLVGMSLWLESYAAAILTIVPVAVVVARIVFEERFLIRELPGYEAYKKKVRYRLLPFIW